MKNIGSNRANERVDDDLALSEEKFVSAATY
jgi:hypothetical protein